MLGRVRASNRALKAFVFVASSSSQTQSYKYSRIRVQSRVHRFEDRHSRGRRSRRPSTLGASLALFLLPLEGARLED